MSYLKHEPLDPNRIVRDISFDDDGNIHIKNTSAYWIPELTVTEEISGTIYTVTGSYEGEDSFIRESVLERMVLKHIQLVMGYILRYRQYFISVMEQQLQLESAEKLQTSRKQLERNERRIAELKRLFIKIYEDNARGDLSDERFEMMSQNYEAEQKQLEAEVVALRQEIEVQERQNENIERFIRTADIYVDIEEFDRCMLRELIKAIYVEAPDKSSGKRRQKIHIEYDGLRTLGVSHSFLWTIWG